MKRLFFALQASAPWPSELPAGRFLEEDQRHLTLAFLGETDFDALSAVLAEFPRPAFKVGFAGQADRLLFLPERHPRCVAWHVKWLEPAEPLIQFRTRLLEWLRQHKFAFREHPEFLPHMTLCRMPFNEEQWKKSFVKLPVMCHHIHLYESLGHSKYQPLWSYPLLPPFQEIEHTADLAFKVYGENLNQLQVHALTALAFKCPDLLNHTHTLTMPQNVDEIIIVLNQIISEIDTTVGCPFKALSFSGEIKEEREILSWEMIVDV